MPHTRRPLHRLAACVAGLGLIFGAVAQTPPAADARSASQRYQQELAACTNGTSHQDPATCRREAVNAMAEARKGRLTTPPSPSANATQRCEALPADHRADCLARMQQGTTQGSVEGGGILREYTRIIPAPAAAQ